MEVKTQVLISDAMKDAGFEELSRSGIVDDRGQEDRMVVARKYRAMVQISQEEAHPRFQRTVHQLKFRHSGKGSRPLRRTRTHSSMNMELPLFPLQRLGALRPNSIFDVRPTAFQCTISFRRCSSCLIRANNPACLGVPCQYGPYWSQRPRSGSIFSGAIRCS